MRPSSDKPCARLSHSLCAYGDHTLIMFGGESYGQVLNDLWYFDIPSETWTEIHVKFNIPGRMTHFTCVYNDSLIVLGGMGNK